MKVLEDELPADHLEGPTAFHRLAQQVRVFSSAQENNFYSFWGKSERLVSVFVHKTSIMNEKEKKKTPHWNSSLNT